MGISTDGYQKIVLLFLCLPLFLGACVRLQQPSQKIAYYTLEYDPPAILGEFDTLPVIIRIERFSAAPTYHSHRIIYRDRSFKRDAYVYHQWRDYPDDMVTYFLNRDMKTSGLFKAVLPPESGLPFSHILEGTVEEFYEWDTESDWKAVLFLSIILTARDEKELPKRILFQKTYSTSKPCARKNPRALAEAMSQAMREVSGEIMDEVYHALRDQY